MTTKEIVIPDLSSVILRETKNLRTDSVSDVGRTEHDREGNSQACGKIAGMRGWPQSGGQSMKKVELKIGDKTVEGMLVDFETLREEYNSYKLSDGSIIRMKAVVTNIIRTEEFTPSGEPVYIVNSQNVLVADVPDELKKPERIQ
jgi:hypothetical protein